MANILSGIAGAELSIIPGLSGVGANIASGKTDFTPGFSAQNVITTQAGKLFNGGSKPSQGQVLGASTTAPNDVSNPAYTGQTGTAAAAGGGAGSSADVAAYSDQLTALDQLLGSADVSRNNGVNSINTSANNALARLNQAQSDTLSRYATQKQDTTTDYQKAVQGINNNARSGYNSLQRLLGGTGSAGDILAPFAVSQQANQQKGTSADAFSRNLRDIDTATTGAQQQYRDAQDDLLGQKNNKLQQLISSIDAQKQQYLQQKSAAQNQLNIAKGGSYATPTANNNAIAQLIAEQNGLATQYADPQFQVKDVQTAAPDLGKYSAEAAQLAGGNNLPDEGVDDTTSALQAFLKRQQQGFAY